MHTATERPPFNRLLRVHLDEATLERLQRRAGERAHTLSSTARELIVRRLDQEAGEQAAHYEREAAKARLDRLTDEAQS